MAVAGGTALVASAWVIGLRTLVVPVLVGVSPFLVETVQAFRRSSIVVEAEVITTRNRMGFRDRRRVDRLLTIEWHAGRGYPWELGRRWKAGLRANRGQFQPRFDTIVFNYPDIYDNVLLAGRGFTPNQVRNLARQLGVQFIDFSYTTGSERDDDRRRRTSLHRAARRRIARLGGRS